VSFVVVFYFFNVVIYFQVGVFFSAAIFLVFPSFLVILFLVVGKNIIKGATQMNGHSLKLHYYMFERSQVKDNNLDCHNVFGIFSMNCKAYMFKV
jgi:hypothetical protein